jgi:Zn-dependent protease
MRILRVWRALWACGRTVLRDGWRLVLSLLEKGSQALSYSLSASKDDPSLLRAGFFPGKFVESLLGSRLAFFRRLMAWIVLANVFLLLIFLLHVYQPRGYVWELIPIGLGMVAPSFLLIFWRPLRDLLAASSKKERAKALSGLRDRWQALKKALRIPIKPHWSLLLSIALAIHIFLSLHPEPDPLLLKLPFALLFAVGLHLSVLIHEYGHGYAGILMGYTPKRIHLNIFGGGIVFEEGFPLHARFKKVLWNGIYFQWYFGIVLLNLILFLLPNKAIPFGSAGCTHEYLFITLALVSVINSFMSGMNILPIYPLDGGRLFYLEQIFPKDFTDEDAEFFHLLFPNLTKLAIQEARNLTLIVSIVCLLLIGGLSLFLGSSGLLGALLVLVGFVAPLLLINIALLLNKDRALHTRGFDREHPLKRLWEDLESSSSDEEDASPESKPLSLSEDAPSSEEEASSSSSAPPAQS